MTMRITKFEVGAPDGDGDRAAQVMLGITNPTGVDVRLITTRSLCRAPEGALVTMFDDEHELRLAPAEGIELAQDLGYLSERRVGREAGGLRLEVVAVLHRRQVLQLGEVAVPKHPQSRALLQGTLASECLAPDIKVLVARGKTGVQEGDGDRCSVVIHLPSEDSEECTVESVAPVPEVDVELRSGFVNTGTTVLHKVALRVELLGEDDTRIQQEEFWIERTDPGMPAMVAGRLAVAAEQLRGARLKAALMVYEQVATLRAEAVSSVPTAD